jgi:hypothetical protein
MFKILTYRIINFFFLIPPITIFLKKRFISQNKKKINIYPSKLKTNYFINVIDNIFFKEHILKTKDQNELRSLLSQIPSSEEGRKWAEIYYKRKMGAESEGETLLLFKNLIKFIEANKFENNSDVYIIQVGSSSGRELEYVRNYFPKLNYISTDINDEILNFQKEKYTSKNFNFFKCFAEDIEKCIDYFQIESKKIIIFSSGSLQYVTPFFLKKFFLKISEINNINVFINEPFDLRLLDNKDSLSIDRGPLKFSHNYESYAKNLKILDKNIIKLYRDTGIYYLHLSNK